MPYFIRVFSNMQYFPGRFRFTSGIGLDILLNVIEVLLFLLKQKQRFPLWIFAENGSFISFHGETWSRYLAITKFQISKDLYPQEV